MSLHLTNNVKEQNAGADLHPLSGVVRCRSFSNRSNQAVKAAPSGEQAFRGGVGYRQAIRLQFFEKSSDRPPEPQKSRSNADLQA
jgi:hypothetical protein